MTTMKGLKESFKLTDNKIEEPDVYLGASLSKMINESNKECWAMSADKYCATAVTNVTETLNKKGRRLPNNRTTPLSCGYKPKIDTTTELKANDV